MQARSSSVDEPGLRSHILSELRETVAAGSGANVMQHCVQLIKKGSDCYDWIGIYLVTGTTLSLAAYDGKGETQHVQIPIGQGICGLAAKEAETIIVSDVNKDPRYLMCFPSTRSEIVVPIRGMRGVLGEIDIDSDVPAAFTNHDRQFLETAANILAEHLENKGST